MQIEQSPVCSYKKQDPFFNIFINACCASSLQRQVVWPENNKQRQFYNDFGSVLLMNRLRTDMYDVIMGLFVLVLLIF